MDYILPWLLGVAFGAAVVVVLARRRAPERTTRQETMQLELDMLRDELSHLRVKHQQQLEFFVNFPDIVKSLSGAMRIEEVTSSLSRGITALIDVEMVAVFLAESQTELRLVDGLGFSPKHRNVLKGTLRDLEAKPVLRRRGLVPLDTSPGSYLTRYGLRPEWGVAIWHGERLFGMLVISGIRSEPNHATRVLAMLADLAGVGLAAASRISQIRHEAENDGLTGLANRRTLQRRIVAELQRAASYQAQLSLVMVDVDHFKHYNDTNGHQAGDEVLTKVAGLIRSTTRRTDVVARYGGEEFTVLLIGADQQQAIRHAERIRRAIESHTFAHGSSQPMGRVTISLGLATAPDDAADSAGLFRAADQALYQAKEAGRNRVVPFCGKPLAGDSHDELASESATEQALRDALVDLGAQAPQRSGVLAP